MVVTSKNICVCLQLILSVFQTVTMSCCKLVLYVILSLVLCIGGQAIFNFFDTLRIQQRRDGIVDEFPSQYGDETLWHYINYYQDPCLLYHRNRYLYAAALKYNWTKSIEEAHHIIHAKYPASSVVGVNRYRLCQFECDSRHWIDCSASRQWNGITTG